MSLSGIRNLDYTVLLCERLPETRAFYEQVLGFPVEDDRDGWVSFRVGASLLALRRRGDSLGAAPEPGAVAVQLAFRVPPSALDACHSELSAQGVTIQRGPVELPEWRHRALFFTDPEGNLVEVYAEV